MTTTNEQRRDVGTMERGAADDDAAPWPFGRPTESMGQRDDDEYAPTIVRGRE